MRYRSPGLMASMINAPRPLRATAPAIPQRQHDQHVRGHPIDRRAQVGIQLQQRRRTALTCSRRQRSNSSLCSCLAAFDLRSKETVHLRDGHAGRCATLPQRGQRARSRGRSSIGAWRFHFQRATSVTTVRRASISLASRSAGSSAAAASRSCSIHVRAGARVAFDHVSPVECAIDRVLQSGSGASMIAFRALAPSRAPASARHRSVAALLLQLRFDRIGHHHIRAAGEDFVEHREIVRRGRSAMRPGNSERANFRSCRPDSRSGGPRRD